MRNRARVAFPLLVLFLIGGLLILSPLRLPVVSAQSNDAHRWLYENDELFQQLSGAGQTRLELIFGKKNLAKGIEEPSPSLGPATAVTSAVAAVDNILVNDPGADTTRQDTQSETALVLGSSNIVSAYNNSRFFVMGSVNKFTGFSLSTDGGFSFTDQGSLPTNPDGDAGDPVLARSNSTGTIFLSTLAFTGTKIMLFRSLDDGASFLAPVNGAPGFPAADNLDKEWIAVDNFPGPGQGNIYMAFRDFSIVAARDGIFFTRSTDDGLTWAPNLGTLIASASAAQAANQGAYVTVGPDHAVYVFWWQADGPSFSNRRIIMRKSTDQGLTFGPPITVAANLNSLGSNGDLALNGGFRTNSEPRAAVNPFHGSIYVVFNDCTSRPCTTAADRGNIYFTQSTDGGLTWSARVQLNDDTTTNDQWSPALAVTPDGKSVFVGFYDRRLDPNNSRINWFGAIGSVADDETVTFGPNFLISTADFPVARAQDPVVNAVYMGDYDVAVADSFGFATTWGDNRLSNAFHANQPDVRYAQFPVTGP